ncbi:MAG TPA: HNH endonuclease [Planctomycetaceae bacterium]|nr:HNH endonuclease [Planctomycetaceae bacterium]
MDYVAYHSADLMGGPLGSGPPFGMLTRKPVAHLMGQHVWVIEGRGRKKQYFLKHRFVVDTVDEIDDDHFRFRFSGEDGIDFTTEIALSPLPWFKDFLKAVANFSIGVSTLKPEYLAHFHEISNLRDSPAGKHEDWQLTEGEIQQTLRTFRSRSSIARQACISKHGTSCSVCGMDFGETYGPECTGYIEVHHRDPLSTASGPRSVNPYTDLVPVCPNCHRAAHLLDITVEELRRVWEANQERP